MHQIELASLLLIAFSAIDPIAAQEQKPIELSGHENVVSSLAFSPDGRQLISGSWDRTVRVWNIRSRLATTTLTGHRDWVFAIRQSRQGDRLTTASQKTIRIWHLNSGAERAVHGGLGGAIVNSVTISSDGSLVATGGRDGKVRVWRVGENKPERVIDGFESWVSCLAISKENRVLSAGTRTGQVRIFDLKTGKPKSRIAGHPDQQVMAVAFDPSGETLASGGYDQTVRLWDVATGRETAKLAGHRGLVTSIAWSANGRLLASGERHGSIHVWNNAESNRKVTVIAAHKDSQLGFSVTALAFSPDGTKLASGGYDHMIRVWTLPE